jgi:hypothetical protein
MGLMLTLTPTVYAKERAIEQTKAHKFDDLTHYAARRTTASRTTVSRTTVNRTTVNRPVANPVVNPRPVARTATRQTIVINNRTLNLYVPGARVVAGARCYVVNYGYGTVVRSTCLYGGVYHKTFYID